MLKCCILLCIIMTVRNVHGTARVDPLVNSKVGLIRGLKATDGDYSMFMGIPYAKVDESNPFGLSIPQPPFEDTFEAYDDSAQCPQIKYGEIRGSLDCLHLNIHVPDVASSVNLLPVLVYIHGGRFANGASGSNDFGPKFLVKQNIIVVTVNYRINAYGFMCLDDPRVPGNQGLKDQLAALRWIKENIGAFGGDANKITISGESAGSVSIDLHYLFTDENLFSKAIMQSGTGLSPWAITEPDLEAPIKLAEYLGLENTNLNETLAFLATVDPKLVIAAITDLDLEFKPCVEKDFDGIEKFMPIHPTNVKTTRNLPILIGTNEDELIYIYYNSDLEELGNLFQYNLATNFNFGYELNDMEEIVRHFYIGDKVFNNNVRAEITDFDSDYLFQYPTEQSIKKYVANGARVYRYVFSYQGGRNVMREIYNITTGGACHGDELGYLFQRSWLREEIEPDDQVMIDRITTLWANFVKNSDPTPNTSDLIPVTWSPVSADKMPYLSLDKELSIKSRPFNKRLAFWDLFYAKNEKFQKGYENEDF